MWTKSLLCLAAFRAVEENPKRKVIAEIFKTMFYPGGDKQEIVRPKLPTLARANEIAGAADDNVDLIARVRTLRIATARRIQFHGKCSVLKQYDETFWLRLR